MNDKTTRQLFSILKKQQAILEKLAQSLEPTSPVSMLHADDNAADAGSVQRALHVAFAPFQVEVLSVDGMEGSIPKVMAQASKADHPEGETGLMPKLKQVAMQVLGPMGKAGVAIVLRWV
jgi:hypothetical protein